MNNNDDFEYWLQAVLLRILIVVATLLIGILGFALLGNACEPMRHIEIDGTVVEEPCYEPEPRWSVAVPIPLWQPLYPPPVQPQQQRITGQICTQSYGSTFCTYTTGW